MFIYVSKFCHFYGKMDKYKLFKLQKGNFTWSELKDKYRSLAIKNHPDKGGDQDLFNYITECFKKLAIELKSQEQDKTHDELKKAYKNDSISSRFGVSTNVNFANDNSFNSKFNKMFENNKFIDENIEFGYGDMMVASSKNREDIHIPNHFGSTKVSNNKFNTLFEKRVPTTNIVEYKEPEALPSCKNIIHSEIGTRTRDYSGTTERNTLQYTDFKVAFTESRIPTQDKNKRTFKNVKEYQNFSDTNLKSPFSDKELEGQRKQLMMEEKKEQKRLRRVQERDKNIQDYFDQVSKLMLPT